MEHKGQISVAVRVNGELRAADTELPRNALFPIYSITKTLTAICVLRLAERGLLRLGDSAGQWLPDMDVLAAITLTHLLRHTSGLRDYGPLPDYHRAVRTHPGTLTLYLDGKITHWFGRADGKGVVFILDVASVAEAKALTDTLPFAKMHLATFEFLVLTPLTPLRTLLAEPPHAPKD